MHATVKRKIWSGPSLLSSEPSKFNKIITREKFLFLSMKINDASKKVFSDVVENITSKVFHWVARAAEKETRGKFPRASKSKGAHNTQSFKVWGLHKVSQWILFKISF